MSEQAKAQAWEYDADLGVFVRRKADAMTKHAATGALRKARAKRLRAELEICAPFASRASLRVDHVLYREELVWHRHRLARISPRLGA